VNEILCFSDYVINDCLKKVLVLLMVNGLWQFQTLNVMSQTELKQPKFKHSNYLCFKKLGYVTKIKFIFWLMG
jgi:hypothetical protein